MYICESLTCSNPGTIKLPIYYGRKCYYCFRSKMDEMCGSHIELRKAWLAQTRFYVKKEKEKYLLEMFFELT